MTKQSVPTGDIKAEKEGRKETENAIETQNGVVTEIEVEQSQWRARKCDWNEDQIGHDSGAVDQNTKLKLIEHKGRWNRWSCDSR